MQHLSRFLALAAALPGIACGGGRAAPSSSTEVDVVLHIPRQADEEGEPSASPALGGRPRLVMLALGLRHSCGLSEDGSVYCWGSNAALQLGDIGLQASEVPARVPDLPPMAAVFAGGEQTCASARDDGQLFCWGDTGLPPHGPRGFAEPMPYHHVRAMALGYRKGCFIDDQGMTLCWGDYGAPFPRWDTPHRLAIEGVSQLVAGMIRHCAVVSRGEVSCWGQPPAHTRTRSRGTPIFSLPDLSGVASLAFDPYPPHPPAMYVIDRAAHLLEVTPTGREDTTSGNNHLALRRIGGLEDLVEVDVSAHVCARTSSGTLACWGANGRGQVGDGTGQDRVEPVFLPLTDVDQVEVGLQHTCARTLEGRLFCWGSNERGQLGVEGPDLALGPQEVIW